MFYQRPRLSTGVRFGAGFLLLFLLWAPLFAGKPAEELAKQSAEELAKQPAEELAKQPAEQPPSVLWPPVLSPLRWGDTPEQVAEKFHCKLLLQARIGDLWQIYAMDREMRDIYEFVCLAWFRDGRLVKVSLITSLHQEDPRQAFLALLKWLYPVYAPLTLEDQSGTANNPLKVHRDYHRVSWDFRGTYGSMCVRRWQEEWWDTEVGYIFKENRQLEEVFNKERKTLGVDLVQIGDDFVEYNTKRIRELRQKLHSTEPKVLPVESVSARK